MCSDYILIIIFYKPSSSSKLFKTSKSHYSQIYKHKLYIDNGNVIDRSSAQQVAAVNKLERFQLPAAAESDALPAQRDPLGEEDAGDDGLHHPHRRSPQHHPQRHRQHRHWRAQ